MATFLRNMLVTRARRLGNTRRWTLSLDDTWFLAAHSDEASATVSDRPLPGMHIEIRWLVDEWRVATLPNVLRHEPLTVNDTPVEDTAPLVNGSTISLGSRLHLAFETDELPPDGPEPKDFPVGVEHLRDLFTHRDLRMRHYQGDDTILDDAQAGKRLLGHCKDPRNRTKLATLFQSSLGAGSPFVRAIGLHGLAILKLHQQEDFGLVERAVDGEADARVRTLAVRLVAAIDPLGSAPRFLTRMKEVMSQPSAGADAVQRYTLGLMETRARDLIDDARACAVGVARDSRERLQRLAAVAALSTLATSCDPLPAIRDLRSLLGESDLVRAFSAHTLVLLGDREPLSVARACLLSDDELAVRHAVYALLRAGDAEIAAHMPAEDNPRRELIERTISAYTLQNDRGGETLI